MCSLLRIQTAHHCLHVHALDVAQELLEDQNIHSIGMSNLNDTTLDYLLAKVELQIAQIKQSGVSEANTYSSLGIDLRDLIHKDFEMGDEKARLQKLMIQAQGLDVLTREPSISSAERSTRSLESFKQVSSLVFTLDCLWW